MSTNPQNLRPFPQGNSLGGRPPGTPNRKTILNFFLFEADLNELGVVTNKPVWWDKVKPKNIYSAATIAMGIKAMSGDPQAYNALNKAIGEHHITEGKIDVVHIYQPTELGQNEFEQRAEQMRNRAHNAVEAQLGDMETTTGTAGTSPPDTL